MNPAVAALRSSALRDLLALTRTPGVHSLAGGLPGADLFPVAAVAAAAVRLLDEQPAAVLQYGPTLGDARLREWVARYESDRCGHRVDPDQVLITSGSQQGFDLVGRTLCAPGDVIVVEEPAYLGALQALRAAGAVLEPVTMDADGLDVEQLGVRLAARLRPVAVYTVTTFHNPTGVTLSPARRAQLAALAARHGFIVIEDDPYAELAFPAGPRPRAGEPGGAPAPTQAPLPTVRAFTDDVVTLGSFSKTVAPGLRVGWAVLPERLVPPVTRLKQAADLHSGSFGQGIVAELVTDPGWWSKHLDVLRAAYAARADALGSALAERFGDRLALNVPRGGMFLWGRFTDGTVGTQLLPYALREQVAFVPGQEFFTGPADPATLRLSYAGLPPTALVEAADRLWAAHCRGRRPASSSAR